jgi:hypothetical protein
MRKVMTCGSLHSLTRNREQRLCTCVAGRVDDVELEEPALGAGVRYAGDLGQNGDSAFFLQLVAIHQALADPVARAERVSLVEHGVDERGLAVVNVRDNG